MNLVSAFENRDREREREKKGGLRNMARANTPYSEVWNELI